MRERKLFVNPLHLLVEEVQLSEVKIGPSEFTVFFTGMWVVFDFVFGNQPADLRKIFGPTYENGSWRIKTNQELDKIIKHNNIIKFARAQRQGWYGHIESTQETRMVKAIHSWKPISKRPTGRPKIRWENDVKKRYHHHHQ